MLASADGCKGGWLLAMSETWPCEQPPLLCICANFRALLHATRECRAVVVDIPIGLPSGKTPRQCDIEARAMLGKQGQARVFLAPPRECLNAKGKEEFQRIHRIEREKGAGYPVWGILPKLKETDGAMRPDEQDRIYEFHPELAWYNIAKQVLEPKHTEGGLETRQRMLQRNVPDMHGITNWCRRLGRAAALDDLLDAIVGLSVAQRIFEKQSPPHRLPAGAVPRDAKNLRMEIWY